jgi:hypothetical protein
VGAGLHGYPAGWQAGELAPEGRFGGGDAGFFDEFAFGIQNIWVGALVSQVYSYESRAILNHGRFLLLAPLSALRLCSSPKVADELPADTMKHVDRGTGLLIPI